MILASKAKILHYGIELCIVPQQFFFSLYVIDFWWHDEEKFAFEPSKIAHRECLHLPVCLFSKQWSLVELQSVGNWNTGDTLNPSSFCLTAHCSFHALWSPVLRHLSFLIEYWKKCFVVCGMFCRLKWSRHYFTVACNCGEPQRTTKVVFYNPMFYINLWQYCINT